MGEVSYRKHVCVTMWCDTCEEYLGFDEGELHFQSESEARTHATDRDWTANDERHECRTCSERRVCREGAGHVALVLPSFEVEGRKYPESCYCDRCGIRVNADGSEATRQ